MRITDRKVASFDPLRTKVAENHLCLSSNRKRRRPNLWPIVRKSQSLVIPPCFIGGPSGPWGSCSVSSLYFPGSGWLSSQKRPRSFVRRKLLEQPKKVRKRAIRIVRSSFCRRKNSCRPSIRTIRIRLLRNCAIFGGQRIRRPLCYHLAVGHCHHQRSAARLVVVSGDF